MKRFENVVEGVTMKSAALLLIIATAIFLPAQAEETPADDTRTLNGEFHWTDRGKRGDIEAVFTPAGDGKWDVAFHFSFRRQEHVFRGTAEGSLSDGALSGEVFSENRRRTFTFNGKFKDGKFRGDHAEIEGGRKHSTGTLTLGE